MNELLELNSQNLKKGYFWISGIMTAFLLLFLAFFYSEISLKWIIITLISTLILVPLFIISIWTLDWYRNRLHYKKIKSKKPYNKLNEVGFTKRQKVTIHFNGMNDYYDYAIIKNWKIDFLTFAFKSKSVTFQILGIIENFENKKNKYKNIEIDKYGVYKTVKIKNGNINSIQDVKKIISELIEVAEKVKCKQIKTE